MAKTIRSISIDTDVNEWIKKQPRDFNLSGTVNDFLRSKMGKSERAESIRNAIEGYERQLEDIQDHLLPLRSKLERIEASQNEERKKWIRNIPNKYLYDRRTLQSLRVEYEKKFGGISQSEWEMILAQVGLEDKTEQEG